MLVTVRNSFGDLTISFVENVLSFISFNDDTFCMCLWNDEMSHYALYYTNVNPLNKIVNGNMDSDCC